MADQSLQAFQLGASLFDRAQTQARMMEQFKLQSAESVLQQQGMALQNQIRDAQLAEAIGEQKAQVDEFNAFSTLGQQVSDYLNNPKEDAVFPAVPAFKSKQFRAEADRMLNNLEKYSARAKLLKAKDAAETAANNLTATQFKIAADYGAFKTNPQTGKLEVDYDAVNNIAQKIKTAKLSETEAKTKSILGNLEVAKDNLLRLTREGADKITLQKARDEYKKALDDEKLSLEKSKFDFTKGLQIEKLALEKVRVDQLGKRADAYVQKILQPAKEGDIKLNAVDDRLVKKAADDIANKQTISDAIAYEIGVLEDDTVQDYVKLNSANTIAKVLNSAEGKDAVGVEESKRLLGELDLLNFRRAWESKDPTKLLGSDMGSFVEKLKLKQGELDSRVKQNMDRVNSIYQKYGKPVPAGTSQTPSRSTMITAPALQAAGSTNMTASIPSFKTLQEAKSAGVQPGSKVIINGVQGTIK
jgi:hypothetical protein